jgi:hypothetical protein
MNEDIAKIAAWSIAWEGHIGFHRIRNKKAKNGYLIGPNIGISNTNEELLKNFRDMVGMGRIYRSSKQKGKRSTVFQWRIWNQEHAEEFLSAILPFLPAKKDRAEAVLDFVRSRRLNGNHHTRGRPYTEEEIKLGTREFC